MSLKKAFTVGVILTCFNPLLTQASDLILRTVNNTEEFSSVYVTNRGCAPKTTPKHSSLDTKLTEAKIICLKLSGFCEATMYSTKDCQGDPVAVLKMDLSNAHVTITKQYETKYDVVAENNDNGSVVTVNYKTTL